MDTGQILQNHALLNQFLADVEKRAYRLAYIACQREAEALDIVQDAMLTLARAYAERAPSEWPGLFQRILQNKIRDWYRRQQVMRKVFFWRSPGDAAGVDSFHDDLHHSAQARQGVHSDCVDNAPEQAHHGPARQLHSQQLAQAIDQALSGLPLRQQQAFLLRCWEGLSVRQTAMAMGLSEGSVKTHYSRALQGLQQALGPFAND